MLGDKMEPSDDADVHVLFDLTMYILGFDACFFVISDLRWLPEMRTSRTSTEAGFHVSWLCFDLDFYMEVEEE